MMVVREDRNAVMRKNLKKLPVPTYKFARNINTNFKFGVSQDFPFVSQYTEFHTLTQTLLPDSEPEYVQRAKQVNNQSIIFYR